MLKKIFYSNCKIRHFLAVLLFLFIQLQNYAQVCTGCTTVITSNTSVNISIGPTDFVCIAPGVSATGNITLNGGKLCNEGIVNNLTLIEGTFDNHGSFIKPTGNLNISNAKNLKINCYENSVFDVSNAINIDGANNTDSIVFNVFSGSSLFSIGKDLSISKGWLKIANSISSGGSGIIVVGLPSIINIGGQLNVSNSALRLKNYGTFNVAKAINLEGKYTKEIFNYNYLNCNNSLNITGNGQNTASVSINNYSIFNVTRHLNSSYNNGIVNIINDPSLGTSDLGLVPVFNVGLSMTISKDNNSFSNLNNGIAYIGRDLNLERGTIINNGTININRDFDIKQGEFTNNFSAYVTRDFIISNASGITHNNGLITILRSFENNGTINLSKYAYINTHNYYNRNNGTINGPTAIQSDEEYAKIFIAGNSENSGFINGKVLIYDQTLLLTNNNIDYGFDVVSNANRISSNTAFAAKSAGPGNPPGINCILLQQIFSVVANASPSTICPGTSSSLTSQLMQKITINFFGNPITFYIPVSITASSYSWLPSSSLSCSNCQNPTASPLVTTQYIVSVTHATCVFTVAVTVNVLPPMLINPPTTYFTAPNSPVILGATPIVSGGTAPYSYQWTQSSTLFSTLENPICTTAVNTTFNLQVTDASGCIINQIYNVFVVNGGSYAVFKRQLDAGFYQLTNGNLYFTIDGEYNTSSLNYKIIDDKKAIVTTGAPTLNLSNGDNRYYLDLKTLGFTTANNNKYYVVEVQNEKNELFLLKIKYAQ